MYAKPWLWFGGYALALNVLSGCALQKKDDLADFTATVTPRVKPYHFAYDAGRADIEITSGDLPPSIEIVDATECWSTDFTQSYYDDSVDFAPSAGILSACVYQSM